MYINLEADQVISELVKEYVHKNQVFRDTVRQLNNKLLGMLSLRDVAARVAYAQREVEHYEDLLRNGTVRENTNPHTTIYAAVDKTGVIGAHRGDEMCIPWDNPLDRRTFKQMTYGSTCIMGASTAESMGKPLLGRINFVLSRNPSEYEGELWFGDYPGIWMFYSDIGLAHSVALELGLPVSLIGGRSVYEYGLNLPASKAFISLIDVDVESSGNYSGLIRMPGLTLPAPGGPVLDTRLEGFSDAPEFHLKSSSCGNHSLRILEFST